MEGIAMTCKYCICCSDCVISGEITQKNSKRTYFTAPTKSPFHLEGEKQVRHSLMLHTSEYCSKPKHDQYIYKCNCMKLITIFCDLFYTFCRLMRPSYFTVIYSKCIHHLYFQAHRI